MTGAYFVCGMTTAIISAHFIPFAIERGNSPGMAAMAFGMMSALNIVGVLVAGSISDKFGRKNVLGTIYAIRGLAYVALLLAPGSSGIWVFALVAGFSWVASAALTSSLTADIYGLKNMGTLRRHDDISPPDGQCAQCILGRRAIRRFRIVHCPVRNCRRSADWRYHFRVQRQREEVLE